MKLHRALVVAPCAALLLTACAGSGGASTTESNRKPVAAASSTGGSLWDRLEAARKEKEARGGSDALDSGPGAAEIPADLRARCDDWWRLFIQNDARWPAAKAEWRASPAPAPQVLTENLLRRHVLAFDAGSRSEFERTKREIVGLGDAATPLLVAGLAQNAGDTVVRQHAAELLGAIGPSTIPALERALDGAPDRGRWEIVRALSRLKNPATTPALRRTALASGPFEPRIEAVKGLAENGDPAGYETVLKCLGDDDPSVRKFAARHVVAYRKVEAAPELVAYMRRAESDRDQEGAAEAHEALRKLLKRDAAPNASAWEVEILRVRAGSGSPR